MKIALLGPEGTFSHQAAMKYDPGMEPILTKTIHDVFAEVEAGRAEKGIVPVENSIGGSVHFTMDGLYDHDLTIEAEVIIPVVHNLMAKSEVGLDQITELYVHEQTLEQCEEYILKHLPKAKIIETASNAESARLASLSLVQAAAIGPEIAAEIYGLIVLKRSVQEKRHNVTRFFVINHTQVKPTGYDKTSIAIYPQVDRPGLLLEMLKTFKDNGINLTKIESRPSKGKLGDYVFFIDFAGHRDEDNVAKALAEIEKSYFVKVLGSYPREY